MDRIDENLSIQMTGICKYYPGVKALEDVKFELRKGEVHSLLGENGAGKSTLCKIIAGAQPKSAGVYYLLGEKIESLSPMDAKKKGVSIIYQEFNLVPYLKVYENLFLGKELMKGPNTDRKAMIEKSKEVFKSFDIDIDPERKVSDLSNAYKQLVEIVKAILEDAKVLCMDEPTAPLTNREVKILFKMVDILKKKGVSIIYISHRLEELFEVSDRITVMRDGRYIKTLNTSETNKEELVKLMVGRELNADYPKRDALLTEEVLRVENLSTENTGISDVSFSLKKGEILGFAGLVGAGRTEVMRALFGVDKKKTGKIFLNGKEITINSASDAIKNGISLVPEDRKGQGVSLTMSIRENISIVKLKAIEKFLSIDRKKDKEIAQKYIEALAIKTPSMEQLAKNLSGGNQQKVAVAKWLAMNSSIIILDEPTRGIDVGAKYEIYNLMNNLVKEGKSLIMISSEMPELLGMSDRVIVMHRGKLAGCLESEEIKGEGNIQETVLEMASGMKERGGE